MKTKSQNAGQFSKNENYLTTKNLTLKSIDTQLLKEVVVITISAVFFFTVLIESFIS